MQKREVFFRLNSFSSFINVWVYICCVYIVDWYPLRFRFFFLQLFPLLPFDSVHFEKYYQRVFVVRCVLCHSIRPVCGTDVELFDKLCVSKSMEWISAREHQTKSKWRLQYSLAPSHSHSLTRICCFIFIIFTYLYLFQRNFPLRYIQSTQK